MVELHLHSSICLHDTELNYLNTGRSLPSNDPLTVFTPNLGPTQPPMLCVPGALSPGVKLPGLEVHYSPPFSIEI
jgi:hypothetical protein